MNLKYFFAPQYIVVYKFLNFKAGVRAYELPKYLTVDSHHRRLGVAQTFSGTQRCGLIDLRQIFLAELYLQGSEVIF